MDLKYPDSNTDLEEFGQMCYGNIPNVSSVAIMSI